MCPVISVVWVAMCTVFLCDINALQGFCEWLRDAFFLIFMCLQERVSWKFVQDSERPLERWGVWTQSQGYATNEHLAQPELDYATL
jgi:hypothetical protein